MLLYICLAILIYKLADYLIRIPKTTSPTGKRDYILITGCDSGFGNLFARRLDSKGFHVFAACLTEAGKRGLEDATSPKLRAFTMDVTNQESIQNGYTFVSTSLRGTGLWALMNNAGIQGPTGPSEWMTLQHFQLVMDINFLAIVQVTNTFLPLLKKTKGRIVNTASLLGRFPFSGVAPYVAAKHAVEGYSSSLRMEMKPFQISVHLIEPGFFGTRMTNPDAVHANIHLTWDPLSPEMKAEYGEQYLEGTKKVASEAIQDITSPRLDRVIDAYEHAALGTFPRARYLVGYDARFFFWPLMFMPEWFVDFVMLSAGRTPTPDSVLNNKYD